MFLYINNIHDINDKFFPLLYLAKSNYSGHVFVASKL